MADEVLQETEKSGDAKETLTERRRAILNYLLKGYAKTSMIHEAILETRSIQTTRRELQALHQQKFIDRKELPKGDDKKGSAEMVHYLTPDGLKMLGKNAQQISVYHKCLSRIHISKMRHYLETVRIEDQFTNSVAQSGYRLDSRNEFNDDNGILCIKTRQEGKFIDINSDGILKISRNGAERLIARIETDMGTEPITTLLKKMDSYYAYSQSPLINSHAKTFPVYVLFILSEKRLSALLHRTCKHPGAGMFLLLSWEKSKQNLFSDAVLLDCKTGTPVSIASLVRDRESLLNFHHAVTTAAKNQKKYEITIQSRFYNAKDAFFPITLFDMNGRGILFAPDGYLKIRGESQNRWQDKLNALILSICKENRNEIVKKIFAYEIFLSQECYRTKFSDCPCYGCIIIAPDKKIPEVQAALQDSKIKSRIRIIAENDCKADSVFYEPVWMGVENGQRVTFFPVLCATSPFM